MAGSATGTRLEDAPLSLGTLVGLFALSWAVGWFLRQATHKAIVIVGGTCFFLSLIFVLWTSPSAYGAITGSRLAAFASDWGTASPRILTALLLVPLVVYIWWRGYSTGRETPGTSAVMTRFKLGLGAMLIAIAATATLEGAERDAVLGALAILLPVQVFCGLVANGLARMAEEQTRRVAGATDTAAERPWLGLSLTLAGLIVGLAMALSLVVNYQSIGALLGHLGILGAFLNDAAHWLIELLAQVLNFLFGGLVNALSGKTTTPPRLQPPTNPHCIPTIQNPCSTVHDTSQIKLWLHVATIVSQVIILAAFLGVLLFVLRGVLFGLRLHRPEYDAMEEDRESLDGKSLFRQQVRAFFDQFQRRRPAPAMDPLTPGSVRYLYRELLQAAAAQGLRRKPAETPDEYAERLVTVKPTATATTDDVRALSDAYTTTRYGEREPGEPERKRLRQITDRLRRALARG
ncbi:MAG: hypothetical protein OJF49_000388 [Ktedonobacterales bacterium]|nr:MAG: hypothetical protein OJF49_000388 [Ktedonobacterales bacterium]